MKTLLINPVLNKEIKLRLRSLKSFLGILFYLIALGIVAIGFIYITMMNSQAGYIRPQESRMMFMVLSMVQLGLIIFMTPGLTAGVISGERERQTLNMLLTTEQSSTSIILSKLISSVAFLFLMISASLPLYSIVFLYGGVSPGVLLGTFGIYVITIITVGSIGILFSTLLKKTIVAMIATYGVAIFLTAGTGFISLFFMNAFFYGNTTNVAPYFMIMTNPAFVLMTVFEPNMQEEFVTRTGIELPFWISFGVSFIVIAAASLWISITKLRPNMKPSRRGRKKDA
ncbi:ABC transporter permease subunit [Rossellomorea vietnamensis]|uniref:ABC transporter permease subunit n=1 Tax=Rossellomorea vietnamensis TaxID=218284 RepID=A0A5D4NS11_9BACI|nr:ABC transporter permease [Rossellomorea vietnamensis]TYS16680.1 ABC transporter permease subunit [Rossellomorea vietnamensis]